MSDTIIGTASLQPLDIERVRDIRGNRYGKLVVTALAPRVGKKIRWHCICDCGNYCTKNSAEIRSGKTKSCGCLCGEVTAKRNEIDITGERFGRLTAIERVCKGKGGWKWFCRCDCGNAKTVIAAHLRSGNCKSCGCWPKNGEYNGWYKDGRRKRPEMVVYTNMVLRCTKTDDRTYHNYGGRGIKVCERWLEDFAHFFADMGERPDGYTLERVDNNGNYCPENCRWASRDEQARNKRNNRYLEFRGERKLMVEWAELFKVPYKALHARINRYKWDVERAITQPYRGW